MRWPTDGSHLSNASGEGSPTLISSAASVCHGGDGGRADGRSARARRVSAMDATNDGTRHSGRKIPAHPYLARQMSDIGFRQNPYGSNSGVHAKIFPLPIHILTPH